MRNGKFVFLHNLGHLCCMSNLSLRARWYTLKQKIIFARKYFESKSGNIGSVVTAVCRFYMFRTPWGDMLVTALQVSDRDSHCYVLNVVTESVSRGEFSSAYKNDKYHFKY